MIHVFLFIIISIITFRVMITDVNHRNKMSLNAFNGILLMIIIGAIPSSSSIIMMIICAFFAVTFFKRTVFCPINKNVS